MRESERLVRADVPVAEQSAADGSRLDAAGKVPPSPRQRKCDRSGRTRADTRTAPERFPMSGKLSPRRSAETGWPRGHQLLSTQSSKVISIFFLTFPTEVQNAPQRSSPPGGETTETLDIFLFLRSPAPNSCRA
jgi:hypothetical protein